MGGRLRKPDQTPSEPPPPGEFELAEARLAKRETFLDSLKAEVDRQLSSGAADAATIREGGSIARAYIQLEAERRQQTKAKNAKSESMSLEQVLAWARQQSADKRSHLARELAQMDAGGSVLA